MKKVIFLLLIFLNGNIKADELNDVIDKQIDFFSKNSYSCKFKVPDPINSSATVNALVPLHQMHFDCSSSDFEKNESVIGLDDRNSTGDSVLFSATMCRTGLTQFCNNVRNSLHADAGTDENKDGQPFRSPILKKTKNFEGDKNNPFSMDHTLGILLYLETSYNNIQNSKKNGFTNSKEQSQALEDLQSYAIHFANYIEKNKNLFGYQVCPVPPNGLDYCGIIMPGEVQLFQDVYKYIGLGIPKLLIGFPIQVDSFYTKSDVNAFFSLQAGACFFKPGFQCNLASVIYLIEKDISFSKERNPNLQNDMEETRKSMLTLSSNNSFQTFALTAPDEKPDWNQLAKKTTDVCKLSMNNPQWITADNRPDWLWEQSNSAITTNQTAWGWDCLGMLTLLKNNLKTK